jgi:RNA polymerase sigma-70 factor (ECF subfamily)
MVTPLDKYSEFTVLFRSGLEGNRDDYARFLTAITPLLKRMVGRRLAQCDIEDVTQEILISIHKARHTYDGVRPLMPWLAAIAKFRISDHLRKYYTQMQHQTVDIHELEEILPNVTQDGESYEYIDELLVGVPENHKRILTLMHVQGYTAKEVGAQMEMNESAVKVAAHRALKKIREKFGA